MLFFRCFSQKPARLDIYLIWMSLHVATDEKAVKLLNDPEFSDRWTALYQECPWSTVFQSHEYIEIWYRNYKETCDLILIYEADAEGKLIGLFPLERCLETDKLSIAGGYHAEYQTWLATIENGNSFPEIALEKLKEEFPGGRLQLMFLAPDTPLEWLEKKWRGQIRLQTIPRPLVDLGDRNTSDKSLRKRGNKSRVRQLKKLGELKIDNKISVAEFERTFDQLEDYSRLRLSALHNVQGETDKNRKALHVDLMRKTNLVYPSFLRIDEKIASAQVCIENKDEMLLSITSMSPFYAKQSPSKIHMLMLGRELTKTDYNTFDLSPGNGYKERFATDILESYSLTVFFRKTDFLAHTAMRKFIKLGKETLERVNFKRTRVFNLADRFLHKLKRVKFWTLPRTILKAVGRKFYEHKECRIYSFDTHRIKLLENPNMMAVNSVSDLLKYEPTEGWQMTTSDFHKKVLGNFEKGIHSYTHSDGEKLLHHGWMLERQKISEVYEVNQEFTLPDNTAVLFDYYTHPDARGMGLYRNSILQGIHDAARVPDTENVFIGVMADNAPSRHVIEKLGFEYEGSLFEETKLGRTRRWQNWGTESKIKAFEPVIEEVYVA